MALYSYGRRKTIVRVWREPAGTASSNSVSIYIIMACIVMAVHDPYSYGLYSCDPRWLWPHIVMAYIVMANMIMALCSYGRRKTIVRVCRDPAGTASSNSVSIAEGDARLSA